MSSHIEIRSQRFEGSRQAAMKTRPPKSVAAIKRVENGEVFLGSGAAAYVTRPGGGKASARDGRQGYPNALREIRRAIGRLRGLVDQRASTQFVKRQRRIHPARIIEVAVDQAVEQVADVETADSAGGVRITHDVDGAAVGQQMIELRTI